jgi:hypothetical protein
VACRPGLAERVSEGPLAWVSVSLSRTSSLLPWSLAELVLVLAFLLTVWLLGLGLIRSLKTRNVGPAGRAILELLSWGAMVVLVFTILFGIDYDIPELASRLQWRGADEATFLEASRAAVDLGNETYREAFGTADLGGPSPLPGDGRVDHQIDAGYDRLAERLGMGAAFRASRGGAKPVLLSPLMCRLGLSGFYFPLTGEANFNTMVPACERALTIAHEKAHQRGIAREDEANFMGALACLYADEPALHYGGAFFAENELLRELSRRRAPELADLLGRRAPGVVRDAQEVNRFWRRYRGVASDVSNAVNDRYLKSQGIREGTRSYEESAHLLALFFARSCRGSRCSF